MKSGFVAIIGKPNVGKSTLMNSFVGEKLSIVTPKAQTTRKKVLGILSHTDYQIVFYDTPGIIEPGYEMQRAMMKFVGESIEEADEILVMVDPDDFTTIDDYFPEEIIETLRKTPLPVVCAINKIDQIVDKRALLPAIDKLDQSGIFDEIVPISAAKGTNLGELLDVLIGRLAEGSYYYDPEMLSIHSERFFVSELIREQIFLTFREEVPYSTEVNISEFKERAEGKWYIAADVIVERDSQKKILIGAEGRMIKRLGSRARQEIEDHLGMPVFLELFVKVRDKWRSNKTFLKSYGYYTKR